MNEITDVRELARDMREYIETHGWIQDRGEDYETGEVCLLGALCHVTGSRSRESDLHRFVAVFQRVTGRVTGTRAVQYYVVPEWNDAPERTYEDVILLLKQIEDGA